MKLHSGKRLKEPLRKCYLLYTILSSFRRKPESSTARDGQHILASRRNGTLYVGVTTDLAKRIYEHKHDVVEGFTKRYRVHTLVWFEVHESMETAIAREKAIKEWNASENWR